MPSERGFPPADAQTHEDACLRGGGNKRLACLLALRRASGTSSGLLTDETERHGTLGFQSAPFGLLSAARGEPEAVSQRC